MRRQLSTMGSWPVDLSTPPVVVEQELKGRGIWDFLGCFCRAVKETSASERISYIFDHHSDHRGTDDPKLDTEAESDEYEDRSEDVSLAVELKYLYPLLKPGCSDPEPDDPRPVQPALYPDDKPASQQQVMAFLTQTIKETGESAITKVEIEKGGQKESEFWASTWIVKKAGSPEPLDREKRLEGYSWASVEICSPKMLANDGQTRSRVQSILKALMSKHRLVINGSCDTHCHLGRIDDRPYSLSTLKRLAAILWVSEPTLRSTRDPKSPNYDNVYSWGFELVKHSRLAKSLEGSEGLLTRRAVDREAHDIPDRQIVRAVCGQKTVSAKDLTALREIWSKTSHEELGKLLSGDARMHRRLGFNFSAFGLEDERARTNPRTIEFRFMEGSTDIDMVLGWLTISATIVEVAASKSDRRFEAALSRMLQKSLEGEREAVVGRETRGDRLGRDFAQLMDDLGVSHDISRGFVEKITREN
ncbi:hypothetical protein QBC36DRAFT_45630 [Triangularia setosa]|uniref:Amidoligase enzyme-domain-containing protein n=1 Tax=Triangularia setosa TaxID=2587417 RepID=A0AAN7A5M8_9PEZI|nr:hypothetical protein QBC36DRAFT_45630 [Podospora setosa]